MENIKKQLEQEQLLLLSRTFPSTASGSDLRWAASNNNNSHRGRERGHHISEFLSFPQISESPVIKIASPVRQVQLSVAV